MMSFFRSLWTNLFAARRDVPYWQQHQRTARVSTDSSSCVGVVTTTHQVALLRSVFSPYVAVVLCADQ
jgi:hypothetical protein